MAISICFSINALKNALERERDKFGRVLTWTMVFISLYTRALGYFVFGEVPRIIWCRLGYHNGEAWSCCDLSFHGGLEDEVVEKQFWGGRYCLWLRVLEWSLVTLLVHRFCYFHVFAGMVCVDWSFFFFSFLTTLVLGVFLGFQEFVFLFKDIFAIMVGYLNIYCFWLSIVYHLPISAKR